MSQGIGNEGVKRKLACVPVVDFQGSEQQYMYSSSVSTRELGRAPTRRQSQTVAWSVFQSEGIFLPGILNLQTPRTPLMLRMLITEHLAVYRESESQVKMFFRIPLKTIIAFVAWTSLNQPGYSLSPGLGGRGRGNNLRVASFLLSS